MTKFTKIRSDLVRIEDDAGNVIALLTSQEEPTLFEETPGQDTSLIRQRLQEILERHVKSADTQMLGGGIYEYCEVCWDEDPNNHALWPCDAYTAAHIGLAALDG